ncbi:DUF1840 domain-containing protein [Noviherbaspirillum sp. UKPF54]|uniref:DUF1840 domain-containing protein n=1 Tax=Noviherbaspirillum sp. UKPF54 TaxID=2601898 RepID=UPI0011B11455|nr:DUF1840 domain-containing protein [Noviherbaspirillum sp. UKPF54]QDZ29230.1 DUF1840 domain-containing protein [Noviherbaspirillum sp. UKPF54]
MLVTFKSKAAAEVLMYEDHAKRILDLLHKDVKQGIITAGEMPRAVTTLEEEIAESRRHPASEEVERDVLAHHGEDVEDNEHEPVEFVSFATRAYPLLEMLRAARRENNDVMWGV